MEIRPGEARDLESLNDLYNAYVVDSPVTFDLVPITMAQREEWFESFGGRYHLIVAIEDDVVRAYALSKSFRPKQAYETSVETSVYVATGHEARGIGSRLYSVLFDRLAGQDVHRAYAGITMPNDASVALHEKFGFGKVAHFTEQGRKFGKYWDVAWFEKAL